MCLKTSTLDLIQKAERRCLKTSNKYIVHIKVGVNHILVMMLPNFVRWTVYERQKSGCRKTLIPIPLILFLIEMSLVRMDTSHVNKGVLKETTTSPSSSTIRRYVVFPTLSRLLNVLEVYN